MPPPQEFDGYELIKCLGVGGMGEVYLALDRLLDRHVAIKFIMGPQADTLARSRFLVEARAFARLQHPNVVSIYRVGEVKGTPYLVSEYVSGKSLDALNMPMKPVQVLQVAAGLARGLAAAHKRGVIHRDIKPANVILTDSGEAKLLDFGIAKLLDSVIDLSPSMAQTVIEESKHDKAVTTVVLSPEQMSEVNMDTLDEPDIELIGNRPHFRSAPNRKRAIGFNTSEVNADGTLTETGQLIGTPKYVAPELWLGDPPTFRSDVYSFGALVYYLCTGKAPHDGYSLVEIGRKITNDDAIPLAEVAPDVDPAFARVVDRCLSRRPEGRYADGNELRTAIAQLTPEMRADVLPEGNPYRGLNPFEVEHKNLFFGRDSEIRMILDRLKSDPFLLVVGDSGVGKSSLCRAGVIPRFEKWMGENPRWAMVNIVPGPHPVISLSEGIASIVGLSVQQAERTIREEPASFARMLRTSTIYDGVLVFVDQLEELVTLSDPEEAAVLARLLQWLTVPTPGVRVLATVRGDFLSRLAALPEMTDHLSRTLFFLRPLTSDRIREAVTGPARAKGIRFESDVLVDQLVDSTVRAQGGLPLLQFALRELWHARERQSGQITAGSLDSIGGFEGALSRHADDIIAQLLPKDRWTAKRFLQDLVTPEGLRARKNEDELGVANSSNGPEVLDTLIRGRIIVATVGTAGVAYEISHEALLTKWSTLASWLVENADARLARARLNLAVKEWARLDRAHEALWSVRQLEEVVHIEKKLLTDLDKEFIARSHRATRRSKVTRFSILFGVPLLVTLVYVAVVFRAKAELTGRVDAEVAKASQVLLEAREDKRRAGVLKQEAFELFDLPDLESAEQLWDKYLLSEQKLQPSYSRASQLLETAFLLDRRRPDVKAMFADLLFERALMAEEQHRTVSLEELLQRLELYDDSSRKAKWSMPAKLSIKVAPLNAVLTVSRSVLDEQERYVDEEIKQHIGELADFELPPGSYKLTATAANRETVVYPLYLERGQVEEVNIELPLKSEIPTGYVYVPPGRFLFGSAAENRQRRDFFHAAPLHQRETGAYLIAKRETTFAQWIEFLQDLPRPLRKQRYPRVEKGGFQGALVIKDFGDGVFEMTFQPTSQSYVYVAKSGEKIVYPDRDRRKKQDWLKFPVFGITVEDAQEYAHWLHTSGRLEGARLCNEVEWERAARGADGRGFPHGERLGKDDANFDDTYSKLPLAMGPDEVGSYPDSVSPFGLYDMSGNVWEWTQSILEKDGFVARGGSYYFGPNTSRTPERAVTEPSFRDTSVGMRICADFKKAK